MAVPLALSMSLASCKADEDTKAESDPAFVPAAGAVVLALGQGASVTQILGVAMAAVGLGGTLYQWQQNNVHYIALPNPTSTVLDQLLGLGAKPAPSVRIPKGARKLSGVFWKISPEDIPDEAAAARALDKMIRGTKNEVLVQDAKQNRENGWWLVVIENELFTGNSGWEYRLTTVRNSTGTEETRDTHSQRKRNVKRRRCGSSTTLKTGLNRTWRRDTPPMAN